VTVDELLVDRGIDEVLHFTTNTGLIGMLASGLILSRARLPKEKYIEHVYTPNAEVRKDPKWLDYVNLSISRINAQFFGASEHWHRNEKVWWCVVSLDPTLLTHDGVVFATTNNIYTGVRRGVDSEGLEALFAPRIVRWQSSTVARDATMPDSYPTDEQAEVLYPEAVATEFLRGVYVATPAHADIIGAQLEVLGAAVDVGGQPPEIMVRADVFQP
jgi:hypothetical protein